MALTSQLTAAISAAHHPKAAPRPENRPAERPSSRQTDTPPRFVPPQTSSRKDTSAPEPVKENFVTPSLPSGLPELALAESTPAARTYRQQAGLRQYKKQAQPFDPSAFPANSLDSPQISESKTAPVPGFIRKKYLTAPSAQNRGNLDIIY